MDEDGKNKLLCQRLLRAENEKEVISTLKDAGYWDDSDAWRVFGDRENNFSIIGAQQASSVAALVEKLVNSVDAVLLRECLLEGVNPEAKEAPESISKALERYFNIKDGNLANIDSRTRTKLSNNIGLIATGRKTLPNYIVFDRGEGQTPNKMPTTFLSLAESNKLRIPFVQGKFNMGGSGVLRFCGDKGFQLIISRRHPSIPEPNDDSTDYWGFTITRREDPSEGRKNSMYTYLAPFGKILRFRSNELEIPCPRRGTQIIPPLEWGSVIKLFEYEMVAGLKSKIHFGLYNNISLLLPKVGLPIRFYERRNYSGKSLEATMAGLHVRLDEDKRDNLEPNFPTFAEFTALGQKFKASIYAFREGSSDKYRKNEGILFTYCGQTHGAIQQSFFRRVGMSYIADSILVLVECDNISLRAREVLFMNSRDRLSSGELRSAIEKKLEEILGKHQGLRELRERRRREAIESQLLDAKPLRDVLDEILKKSPSLQTLFSKGYDLSNPFKSKLAGEQEEYKGKTYPTYFKLMKGHEEKQCHINLRFRVQFETDVVNDYFMRDRFPGRFVFKLDGNEFSDYVLNLWNGVATLTVTIPEGTKVGDRLRGQVWVTDDTQIEPFYCEFYRNVLSEHKPNGNGTKKRKPPAGEGKGDRKIPDHLALPHVMEVREEDWRRHDFDRFSALKVVDNGEGSYDFFVNIDNVFLNSSLDKNRAAPLRKTALG